MHNGTGRDEAGRSGDRRSLRETGFVLVWMAVMLSVLLGATALAIQWNHLSRDGSRMQKAADAAALAGVVFLPHDPTSAAATAQEIAESNGFVDGENHITVVARQASDPSVLEVIITRDVENIFGTILGDGFTTLQRTGKAQFSSPLPMGAPGNRFGNDPVAFGNTEPAEGVYGDPDGVYPNFWAKIGGAESIHQGEIKMPKMCHSPLEGVFPAVGDLCQADGTNGNFDEQGWIYEIEAGSTDPIDVQIYDPGWVNDLYCGGLGFLGNAIFPGIPPEDEFGNPILIYPERASYLRAMALTPAEIPGYPDDGVSPVTRYKPNQNVDVNQGIPATPTPVPDGYAGVPVPAPGPDGATWPHIAYRNPFCTADNRIFAEGRGPLWTSYVLKGPAPTYNEAEVITDCMQDFPGMANVGGLGQTINIVDQYLRGPADPLGRPSSDAMLPAHVSLFEQRNGPMVDGANMPSFGSHWRAWWSLCDADQGHQVGDKYYLQVRTNVTADGTTVDTAATTTAANQFSVRAFVEGMDPYDENEPTSVAGHGMMQAWMGAAQHGNTDSTITDFYLLRLEPSEFERRLVVSGFDLGDYTCIVDGTVVIDPEDPESPAQPEDCLTTMPVSLQVRPADESKPPFANCTNTLTNRPWVNNRPLGEPQSMGNTCTITNVGTPFGIVAEQTWWGKWVDIVVTVPPRPGYDCDEDDMKDCWLMLRYSHPAHARMHDGAAITATVDGDPVRLVR